MKQKKTPVCRRGEHGLTLIEVIVAMVIVGLSAGVIMYAQKTAWFSSGRSNRLMTAGHLIEQEVERVRIYVAKDPDTRFSYVTGLDGFDTTVNNTLLRWDIVHPAPDIHPDPGPALDNVAQATLTATWSQPFVDSLKVVTYLARNF